MRTAACQHSPFIVSSVTVHNKRRCGPDRGTASRGFSLPQLDHFYSQFSKFKGVTVDFEGHLQIDGEALKMSIVYL